MSNTPETDKEWRHPASFDGSERVVHISVAQKLERERDEARRGIRLMVQNAELWKEKADEAREALRKAKRFVEAFEPRSLGAEVDQNETFNIIRKILEAVE